jgi:signal transduction histidine kinase/ActR/RegA family two-component response regulator
MNQARRVMRVWLGLLLAALFGTGALAATVALDTRAERMDLSSSISLLRDPTGKLHFTEVATLGPEFRAVQRKDLLQSFNAGVFWLRFSLVHSGAQSQTRWLVVGTPKADVVMLFQKNDSGWQMMQAGRRVPVVQKPIIATDAVFPITLAPGENREILLRVDARGAIDMAATLWEPQAYRLASGERNMVLMGILGGILIGGMLALIVFIRLRELPYLWLALMLTAIVGVEASRANLLGIYLWPSQLEFPPQVLSICAGLAIFAMAKVVSAALALPSQATRSDRVLLGLRWIALGGMAVSFFDYGAGVRVISIVTVVLMPASLVFSVLAWRRGHPPARMFMLAFALALVIETARQLANLGVLPWAAAMNFSMAGFLLSTPFILLGMVEQTRLLSQQLLVAEQLQQAKSAFLARVSHELRSPLNTILGFARMLQRGSTRLPLYDGSAGIEKSALRLLGLIDELLDESRAAAGKLAVSPAPTSFKPWLDDVSASAQLASEAQGNRFACVRSGAHIEALAIDAQRLRQVLENLLSNANRHTNQGEIRLECVTQIEGETALLEFAVRDSGEGMDSHQLNGIFEPFVRGQEARIGDRRRRSGFGLGLSISRELIRQMGSDIAVTSELGKGSYFSFTLRCPIVAANEAVTPKHDARPMSVATLPTPASAPLSVSTHRVLLTDDDPQQLQLLGDLLDDAGFVSHGVSSGQAALECLHKQAWGVIVTDQMMADGDGWFLLQRVRESELAVPVVLLSAALPQRPASFPANMEFDAILRKPALSDDLLATLWGLLLKVGTGGTAVSERQWQELATLADDGDVSGIEDWIAALPASPVTEWVRAALNRLDFGLLQRSAMIVPCPKK